MNIRLTFVKNNRSVGTKTFRYSELKKAKVPTVLPIGIEIDSVILEVVG